MDGLVGVAGDVVVVAGASPPNPEGGLAGVVDGVGPVVAVGDVDVIGFTAGSTTTGGLTTTGVGVFVTGVVGVAGSAGTAG